MPQAAVHKSKDKKRKGAASAQNEYSRRLQAFDSDQEIPIGRIVKMLRFDRFLVTFWHEKKRQLLEVQAAVVDKNIERMKPQIGNLVVIVESGKDYEIYLPLKDTDAATRSSRIHKSIQNITSTGTTEDDGGIVFDYGDEEKVVDGVVVPATTENVAKKDKMGKHVERVVREENDEIDDDVNVDNI